MKEVNRHRRAREMFPDPEYNVRNPEPGDTSWKTGVSGLNKIKKIRTKETELVRYLGIKSVRLQEAL
ncbi:hypothetical protein NQ318_018328 [Aromia moschata]|uniref:Uncharacterized protein n=1 Tax=Aromia moschata TaxID=1265417 RepID=A0AAV8YXV0_9CUCU|nr:hypothetical protein NQ318_017032 [Aromia moschata]KAJ8949531.1 hypothetical protein NQ318_005093 [Aromia moschata]KAJ8956638.1 hypothetical protein NQ318_013992 [Aromia moschata]KAJ8962346.1 hypothetical protein NQ318_018328 [Aromia moschata]